MLPTQQPRRGSAPQVMLPGGKGTRQVRRGQQSWLQSLLSPGPRDQAPPSRLWPVGTLKVLRPPNASSRNHADAPIWNLEASHAHPFSHLLLKMHSRSMCQCSGMLVLFNYSNFLILNSHFLQVGTKFIPQYFTIFVAVRTVFHCV